MNSSLDHWFATEVLPHEASLTRYIKRVWRNPSDVLDLRQDVYMRVYESAMKVRPNMPKAFLFATARNLMADRIRQRRIVSIDFTQDLDSLNVLVDEISPEQRLSARQELQRLSDALDRLPEKCRAVIWLRRVEGLSQREAAERLGIKEGTLESHFCRGMRILASVILGHERANESQDGERGSDNESEHGQQGD